MEEISVLGVETPRAISALRRGVRSLEAFVFGIDKAKTFVLFALFADFIFVSFVFLWRWREGNCINRCFVGRWGAKVVFRAKDTAYPRQQQFKRLYALRKRKNEPSES